MAPATPKRAVLSDRDLADLAALSATPLGFAQLASRGRYDAPPHVRLIHDRLLALARRRITRLMIFAPPRHGKSFATSQYFPAWYLGMHPDHRILLASYGADFAATWGRKARDVLEAYGPLLYGVGVRADSSAADAWNLDGGHEGGMNTAGVGGSQTGRGSDVFLIDDPFKNAEEALSPTYREKVWDWYTAVARTRLEPGGAIVLMQTRWHEEDLPGKLIEQMIAGSGEDWHILSLPAIAEEDERIPFLCSQEVYTRRAGEPLWPERFNHDALAAIRNTLESSFWWHALYQQRPTPHGGAIFQRAWLSGASVRRYSSLDALPPLSCVVQSVDSAFETGVGADYSVIATWGTDGRDCYLLGVWRAQVAYPDLIAAIRTEYARWDTWARHSPQGHGLPGVTALLIEKKASGQSALQTLARETSLPVVGVEPRGSKVARAEGVSPLFEGGRVVLPDPTTAPHASTGWLTDWVDEHIRFPRGKHDDAVDTSSQVLTYLRQHWLTEDAAGGGGGGGVVVASTRTHLTPLERAQEDRAALAAQLRARRAALAAVQDGDATPADDAAAEEAALIAAAAAEDDPALTGLPPWVTPDTETDAERERRIRHEAEIAGALRDLSDRFGLGGGGFGTNRG